MTARIPRGIPWQSGLRVITSVDPNHNDVFFIRRSIGYVPFGDLCGIRLDGDAFNSREKQA